MKQESIITKIKKLISDDLKNVPDVWKEKLSLILIEPKKELLSLDSDGKKTKEFWIVTSRGGDMDLANRVTYDEENGTFGEVMTMKNGVEWYVGPSDSFSSALPD